MEYIAGVVANVLSGLEAVNFTLYLPLDGADWMISQYLGARNSSEWWFNLIIWSFLQSTGRNDMDAHYGLNLWGSLKSYILISIRSFSSSTDPGSYKMYSLEDWTIRAHGMILVDLEIPLWGCLQYAIRALAMEGPVPTPGGQIMLLTTKICPSDTEVGLEDHPVHARLLTHPRENKASGITSDELRRTMYVVWANHRACAWR